MKKISLTIVMLLVSLSIMANDNKKSNNVDKPAKSLSTQIGEILGNNSIKVEQDLTANVLFTLNEDKEIVILSVTTDSEIIEHYVKSKLNYQKVNLDNYREGRTYTIPVRITA
jgi:hypothetical protein